MRPPDRSHVSTEQRNPRTLDLHRLSAADCLERIQTEVEWDDWNLLRFLQHIGFRPGSRLSLELPLE